MATFEIPLTPNAQQFEIALSGKKYKIRVRWNVAGACWMFDLSDVDDTPILSSIPMVTGCDLLAPYGYLNLGGKLVVATDYTPDAVPTFDNLGTASHLYWITADD
jgi:hypothetical protein